MSRRYELSKRDQTRFDLLVGKECLGELMTLEERTELAALVRKRRQRFERDPLVKASLQRQRWKLAKTRRLVARLKRHLHAPSPQP